MTCKNFEEFNQKIHPPYGRGTFSKNSDLAGQLIEHLEKKEIEEKKQKERSIDNETLVKTNDKRF